LLGAIDELEPVEIWEISFFKDSVLPAAISSRPWKQEPVKRSEGDIFTLLKELA
jgi:hypothetical protein